MMNGLSQRMRGWTTMAVALVLMSACASQAAPRESAAGQPGPRASQPVAAPKSLIIGVQREPPSFDTDLTGAASSTTGGALSVKRIPHDELVARTPGGAFEPRLAQEIPSV